jgi:K+-sensing histidine kinase KdpD
LTSLLARAYSKLADQEAKLRRAVCNDSLQVIKNLLGAKALTLKHKHKNLRGEGATTRSEAALQGQNEKVVRAQWRYNNSRRALLRVSTLESDRTTYQQLKKEDLKILKTYLEDDSKGLGQGYRAIPWIWRTTAAENNEEWQVEGMYIWPRMISMHETETACRSQL